MWLTLVVLAGQALLSAQSPAPESAGQPTPGVTLDTVDELPPVVEATEDVPGTDPAIWRDGVMAGPTVRHVNVFPGVDLVCTGDAEHVEAILIVHPTADPSQIRLDLLWADALVLDEQGHVRAQTAEGDILVGRPTLSQASDGDRQPVAGGLVQADTALGVWVGVYDPQRPLTVTLAVEFPAGLSRAALDAPATIVVFNPPLDDTLLIEFDGDGQFDPGDTIRYDTTVSNTGGSDATNVEFNDTLDPNTTLVPGSLEVSPVAVDDVYAANAGAGPIAFQGNNLVGVSDELTVTNPAQGLFGNDMDFAGDPCCTLTSPQAGVATPTANGGTATINADGTFVFENTSGFFGDDTFTYTIEDASGLADSATATVDVGGLGILTNGGIPITVTHVNDSGVAGVGTFENPHGSVTDANADPNKASRQIVYVHSNTTFNLQSYALAPNQRLLGEGDNNPQMALTDQRGPVNLPAVNGLGNPRPVFNGFQFPVVDGADDSGIFNLQFLNTGSAIRLLNLAGNVFVDRTDITGPFFGIEVQGGSGQFTFTDVSITDVDNALLVNGGSANINADSSTTINQTTAGFFSAIVFGGHSGTIEFAPGSTITANQGTGSSSTTPTATTASTARPS